MYLKERQKNHIYEIIDTKKCIKLLGLVVMLCLFICLLCMYDLQYNARLSLYICMYDLQYNARLSLYICMYDLQYNARLSLYICMYDLQYNARLSLYICMYDLQYNARLSLYICMYDLQYNARLTAWRVQTRVTVLHQALGTTRGSINVVSRGGDGWNLERGRGGGRFSCIGFVTICAF